MYRERAWTWITDLQTLAQFVPKTWWRWQQPYLLSTPVTLTIVSCFAASLNWSQTTESGGPLGYDAGKKIKSRKRHISTDTEGNLVHAVTHTIHI